MTDFASGAEVQLTSELRCPHCGHCQRDVMPTTSCLYFYECPACQVMLKPKLGDCCVFCSYGDVPCPPVQNEGSCGSLGCDPGADSMTNAELPVTILNPVILSTEAARSAYDAIIRQGFEGKHSEPLTEFESVMLSHMLRLYAVLGRAPSPTELANSSGEATTDVERLMATLAARDFLVLDETGSLFGAYPFTDRPTPHQVVFSGTGSRVHAMCAVDALGTGAMVDQDVEIYSSCAACHAPIMAMTSHKGRRLAVVSPPSVIVRVGATQACRCAAETLCPAIEFICCPGDSGNLAAGLEISAAEALEVGRALFENRARAARIERCAS